MPVATAILTISINQSIHTTSISQMRAQFHFETISF